MGIRRVSREVFSELRFGQWSECSSGARPVGGDDASVTVEARLEATGAGYSEPRSCSMTNQVRERGPSFTSISACPRPLSLTT